MGAVLQGIISPKARDLKGDRSWKNLLLDGVSLACVVYGMSYTDLARKTKCLVGGMLFGSQFAISNVKPTLLMLPK